LITAVAPALRALLHRHFLEAGLAPVTLAFVEQGLANWTLRKLRFSLSIALFSTVARIRKRAANGCRSTTVGRGLLNGHPVAFSAFDLGFSADFKLNPTRTAHAAAIVENQLADGKTLRHLRAVLADDGSFVILGSFDSDGAECVVPLPPALPAAEADDDDALLSSDDDSDTD
jgi:hypothetical protein